MILKLEEDPRRKKNPRHEDELGGMIQLEAMVAGLCAMDATLSESVKTRLTRVFEPLRRGPLQARS